MVIEYAHTKRCPLGESVGDTLGVKKEMPEEGIDISTALIGVVYLIVNLFGSNSTLA